MNFKILFFNEFYVLSWNKALSSKLAQIIEIASLLSILLKLNVDHNSSLLQKYFT